MSSRLQPLILAALFLTCFFTNVQGAEMMSATEIKQGYKKHAALAQLHRWYLLYEKPEYGIDNALDILAEDVRLKSALGEGQGHEQYVERVELLPVTWQNAHDVKVPTVIINEDDTLQLNTDIVYQNVGMLEDGAVRAAELTYTTTLKSTGTLLPKLTSIEIAQKSDGTAEEYTPRYADNRLLSLVHYWVAIIEDPVRDPEPAREILADGFSLNFSSGPIKDFTGFKSWLAGPASQVAASTHKIKDFMLSEVAENEYSISMKFDWNGILPDGTEMTAQTDHTWLVVDDPTERFARIKTIDVRIIEPFKPK